MERKFEDVFKANFNALVSFVCSMGIEQLDAEDIVQKVFIRFWNQKDHYNWKKDPKPYLFKAVRNAAYNHFRDLRLQWSVDEFESELKEEPQIVAKIELAELESHINQLIDDLPPRCRMVFVLSRKDGLSHQQISEIMDISVKTVENQITKALKSIKKGIV